MIIDKRLKVCAEFVCGTGTVCDIGTDHAYLPVYLVKENICVNAVAADINDGPLSAAKQTIEKNNLTDKIYVIKSDGLKNISPENVSDVIIAGMGGELICEILSRCEWIKNGINIILQPMTHAPVLRKWLFENGFEIIKEKPVCDGRFAYSVMKVRYSGKIISPNLFLCEIGKINSDDKDSAAYLEKQKDRLLKIIKGQNESKNSDNKEKTKLLSMIIDKINSILEGKALYTVKDFYAEMDRIAPFSLTEKGDNSGLIVGDKNAPVKKVFLALDITNDVIEEAHEVGAELIISHHPVIYNPVYTLSINNPVYLLAKYEISAICSHSPLDMSENGMNKIICEFLKDPLEIKKCEILEKISSDGKIGFGMICKLNSAISPLKTAEILKQIFGCTVIRYFNAEKPIKKIAFCSGGGGSILPLAYQKDADAFITGDVKHDQFMFAKNYGMSLFDCGHYHTEAIALEYLRYNLQNQLPQAEILIAKNSCDCLSYEF